MKIQERATRAKSRARSVGRAVRRVPNTSEKSARARDGDGWTEAAAIPGAHLHEPIRRQRGPTVRPASRAESGGAGAPRLESRGERDRPPSDETVPPAERRTRLDAVVRSSPA